MYVYPVNTRRRIEEDQWITRINFNSEREGRAIPLLDILSANDGACHSHGIQESCWRVEHKLIQIQPAVFPNRIP
jgi:hypothetical protein